MGLSRIIRFNIRSLKSDSHLPEELFLSASMKALEEKWGKMLYISY